MSADGGSPDIQGSTAPVPSITEAGDSKTLFNQALVDNPGRAWIMATSNLRADTGASSVGETSQSPWVEKEQQAFAAFAENVIAKPVPDDPNERIKLQADIEGLFDSARFRPDGYESGHPSELAMRIAEKMIDVDMQIPGRGVFALQTAEMAHMPEERIESIRKQISSPTAGELLHRAERAYILAARDVIRAPFRLVRLVSRRIGQTKKGSK